MVFSADLAKARRLISEASYRPYVRKVKRREYITLKRGSRRLASDRSAKMFGIAWGLSDS